MLKSLLAGASALALMTGAAWAAAPQNHAANAAQPGRDAPHAAQPAHRDAAKPEPVGQVWDWSKIDTNNDHLIEPAEMEAWLKANPPVQKGG